MPTGPPPNLSMIVVRIRRSSSSKPCSSTSSRASAARAVWTSIVSFPATSAKSRSRRSSRLAMRGVPRLLEPISRAACVVDADAENPRGAVDDLRQRGDVVEVQAQRDAEPAVERLGEQSRPRRRADERERREVHLHRARHRTFADHHVEAEVLHGGIQDLLDGRGEAVDLVDEEHVLRLEVRQDSREVARPRDHRSGGEAQPGRHLAGHDVRQRRLSEPRRAGEENVVERLAAPARGRQEDGEVLADLVLSDVLGQRLRPAASARRRRLPRARCRREFRGSRSLAEVYRSWPE